MATILSSSAREQQRAEALRQMKQRLYNPQAAEEARQSGNDAPNHFDVQAYLEYITNHPVFSNLHLLSKDDE